MCNLIRSTPPFTESPFCFTETGVKAYSLEEVLFHCYNYWKESIGDFLSFKVSKWIRETLELAFVAGSIDKILNTDAPISEKYIGFLSVIDYIDKDDLDMLEYKIIAWENKSEIQKLKQQADERYAGGDFERALYYYDKLIEINEDFAVYNNSGCCLMKLDRYSQAESRFMRALELEPRNTFIKLNMSMLYMLESRSGDAGDLLRKLEQSDNDRNVQYYLGILYKRRGNVKQAKEHFIRAANMGAVLDANSALCAIALQNGDFKEANECLDKIANNPDDKNSRQYLYNKSRVNYAQGDKKEALKNAEQLLIRNFDDVGYFAYAAKLYRENGELGKAEKAGAKALEIDSLNESAILENALIKKETGKLVDYKKGLTGIIDIWKKRYKQSAVD